MLLATILVLGALPQSGELARWVPNAAAASVADAANAKDSSAARELPSMPKPKVAADADGVAVAANVAGAEAVQPPPVALAVQPVKAADTRPPETRRQPGALYTLIAGRHRAAALDPYPTPAPVFRN